MDAATVNDDVVVTGRGRIAATKDILDGVVTIVDMHQSSAVYCVSRSIRCQVTAAIDRSESVGLNVGIGGQLLCIGDIGGIKVGCRRVAVSRMVDMHCGVSEGRARLIVSTIDTTTDDHGVAALGHVADIDGGVSTISHSDVADIGPLTAAEDVVGNGTLVEVDNGVAADTTGDAVRGGAVDGVGTVSAIAATEEGAEAVEHAVVIVAFNSAYLDLGAGDIDFRVPGHSTQLGATID